MGLPQLPPERVGRHGSKLEQSGHTHRREDAPAGGEDAPAGGEARPQEGRRAAGEEDAPAGEEDAPAGEENGARRRQPRLGGGTNCLGPSGPWEARGAGRGPEPPTPTRTVSRLDPFLGSRV